jgi:hypothetical protein
MSEQRRTSHATTNALPCRGAATKPSGPLCWYETAMGMRRPVLPVVVVVAAAFGIWAFTTRHSATPDVVEGWAMPNGSGTAKALHDSDDTRVGNSYVVADVFCRA